MRKDILIILLSFLLFFIQIQSVYAVYDSWINVTPDDASGVIFHTLRSVGDLVYLGTNDGIYKSPDGGLSWSKIDDGLGSNLDITSIAIGWIYDPLSNIYEVSPTTPVFVGTSDGGVFSTTISSNSWTAINTGLGSLEIIDLEIDQFSAVQGSYDNVYVATPAGIYMSTTTGAYWHLIDDGFSGTPRRLTTALGSGKIYVVSSDGGLYESDLWSASGSYESWSLSQNLPGSSIESASVLSAVGHIIWISTEDGVYKSDDGIESWDLKDIGLPDSATSTVVSDYLNQNIAYIPVYGGGVYRTTNEAEGSASPLIPGWLPINIGLDDLYIRSVFTNPSDSSIVYALSDEGVYRLVYGSTPIELIDMTPPSKITDLSVSYTSPVSMTLYWTAPGGNDTFGTSTTYDIRYSTSSPIDDASWEDAIPISPQPTPWGYGYEESYLVNTVPLTDRYYFAMKSMDGPYGGAVLHSSVLSNVTIFSTSTIGGSVDGLVGDLVLSNNNTDVITISSDGLFQFQNYLYTGQSYSISIQDSPLNYVCVLTNNSGTVVNTDISNINVSCTTDESKPLITEFSIFPTYSSLILPIDSFFATDDNAVTAYLLTETPDIPSLDHPNWSLYVPSNYHFETSGSKTLYAWVRDMAGNVSDSMSAVVDISLPLYSFGGDVYGLSGTLTLDFNGVETLVISEDGPFSFVTSLEAEGYYYIDIVSDPVDQTCLVENGYGEIYGDNYNISIVCSNNDIASPLILSSSPSGTLSYGTSQITLSVSTDEISTCKYSNSPGVNYDAMSQSFSSVQGTSHTASIAGISSGSSYIYYVRCKDGYDNTNEDDHTISFSVASYQSPGGSGGGGGGGSSYTNTLVYTTSTPTSTPTQIIIPPINYLATTTHIVSLPAKYAGLMIGSTGLVVMELQKFLNSQGFLVASSGAGSPGKETTYYGTLTDAAVKRYLTYQRTMISSSAQTTQSAQNIQTNQIMGGISTINTVLSLGSSHPQVKELQILLNKIGFKLADIGPGSPGNETSYFGLITDRALKSFQCIKLGVCSGSPATTGYGTTDQKTINAILAMSSQLIPVVPSVATIIPTNVLTIQSNIITTKQSFTRTLNIGSTGEDVKNLQKFLNSRGFIVSYSGAGSKGNETTYYGLATQSALARFQEAHGEKLLFPKGLTVGTGVFDGDTLKFVNSLLGN